MNDLGNKKCDFFFIVGTGRCGTTLTARVMNAHSRICVPHELQIAFEYSHNGERLAEIFASGKNLFYKAEDYIQQVQARCPHDFMAYYNYQAFFNELHYPQLSLRRLLTRFYCNIAQSYRKSIFAEQVPWYGQNIPLLNKIFPKSKFIHLVRDGRDVSISYARTPWWHQDPQQNLQRWQQEIQKIEKDGAHLLKDRFLSIRYEDLVTKPEATVKDMCEFLGVDYEKGMLKSENHIDYTKYKKTWAVCMHGRKIKASNSDPYLPKLKTR